MIPLTLIITRAGMAKFTAAQLTTGLDLTIAAVGLTDQPIVAAPTLEALPGEFRRLMMVSGKQVGDAVVHLTMRDDAELGYTARGFGLFLADGTLFAAYGQNDALFQKSPRATFLSAIDIAFPTGNIDRLTFGNTDFLNPPATTETKGVVELATEVEGLAGTDTLRTPPVSVARAMIAAMVAPLSKAISDLAASAGQALDGLAARTIYGNGLVKGGGRNDANRVLTVDAASPDDVRAGTSGDKAITPAALRGAYSNLFAEQGRRVHPDGFIEMWGRGTHPNIEAEFTLNFPTPFPNACFGVSAMVINTNRSVDGHTTIQEIALSPDSATLFVQNHQSNANEAGGMRWRAWGY